MGNSTLSISQHACSMCSCATAATSSALAAVHAQWARRHVAEWSSHWGRTDSRGRAAPRLITENAARVASCSSLRHCLPSAMAALARLVCCGHCTRTAARVGSSRKAAAAELHQAASSSAFVACSCRQLSSIMASALAQTEKPAASLC